MSRRGRYPAALGELNQCLKRQGETTAVFLDDMPTLRYAGAVEVLAGARPGGAQQRDRCRRTLPGISRPSTCRFSRPARRRRAQTARGALGSALAAGIDALRAAGHVARSAIPAARPSSGSRSTLRRGSRATSARSGDDCPTTQPARERPPSARRSTSATRFAISGRSHRRHVSYPLDEHVSRCGHG